MVDLMPAEFEVPLFAIERVGGVVVKTPDSFHHGGGTPHWSREPNWVSSGDLHPSFMEVALVEKHHFELSDVMFFDIARVDCWGLGFIPRLITLWPGQERIHCKMLRGKRQGWLRGKDLNLRPLGYEPNELPGCSTPRAMLTKR